MRKDQVPGSSSESRGTKRAPTRGEARTAPEEVPPKEVGCWAHARRRFFEAAVVAKDAAAREALLRLHVLFELEKEWQGLAPAQRHAKRQLRSRRLVDDFFAWAKWGIGRSPLSSMSRSISMRSHRPLERCATVVS